MDNTNFFHLKNSDDLSTEHYCMMQYIHYTTKYLPRFISINITYRC